MKIKKDFTQIPNILLRPSKLPITERYLACVLLKYMRKRDFCWPNQMLLAADLGCVDRNIRKLLVKLVDAGYIRKIRSGFNRSNTYVLGAELERVYSSDDTGTAVPNHQGTGVPTNNTYGRIVNKKNVEIKNKIRDRTVEKLSIK